MRQKPDFPQNWNISQTELIAQSANGSVWKCQYANNETVIIKAFLSDDKTEATSGLNYLLWRDGVACVRILAQSKNFIMMEYAGEQALSNLVINNNDKQATLIAANLLRSLHSNPSLSFAENFIPLSDWFASLFIRANSSLLSPLNDFYRDSAKLAQNLIAQCTIAQPLHGDIHHDNILLSPRGWLLIDPKGLIGDPSFDAANLFYNPIQQTQHGLDKNRVIFMATEFSKALEKPVEHILDYAVAYGSLSASWFAEDDNKADELRQLQIARRLKEIKDQLFEA